MRYLLWFLLLANPLEIMASSLYLQQLKGDLKKVLKDKKPYESLVLYLIKNKKDLCENNITCNEKIEQRVENLVEKITIPSFDWKSIFGEWPQWNQNKKCFQAGSNLAVELLKITDMKFYNPNGWYLVGLPNTIVEKNPHLFNFERDTDYPNRDKEMWKKIADKQFNLKHLIVEQYGNPENRKPCKYSLNCLFQKKTPLTFIELGVNKKETLEKISKTYNIKKDRFSLGRLYQSLRVIFDKLESFENERERLVILKEQLKNSFNSNICQ